MGILGHIKSILGIGRLPVGYNIDASLNAKADRIINSVLPLAKEYYAKKNIQVSEFEYRVVDKDKNDPLFGSTDMAFLRDKLSISKKFLEEEGYSDETYEAVALHELSHWANNDGAETEKIINSRIPKNAIQKLVDHIISSSTLSLMTSTCLSSAIQEKVAEFRNKVELRADVESAEIMGTPRYLVELSLSQSKKNGYLSSIPERMTKESLLAAANEIDENFLQKIIKEKIKKDNSGYPTHAERIRNLVSRFPNSWEK